MKLKAIKLTRRQKDYAALRHLDKKRMEKFLKEFSEPEFKTNIN